MTKIQKLAALLIVALAATGAAAQDIYEEEPQHVQPPLGGPDDVDAGRAWEKPLPHVSFALDYTLVTDYVWRGVNYSEYAGERPERLNHQFTFNPEIDLEEMNAGAVGFRFWFNSYSGHQQQPGADSSFIEIDYNVYWAKEFAEWYTAIETGVIWYTFPNVGGDAHDTTEVYVTAAFNDGALWGCEDPVLNPYVYWGMDVDLSNLNQWIEAGVSHEFEMGQYTPILEHVSVIPSFVVGVNHHYLHDFDVKPGTDNPMTTIAFFNYGLEIAYDLSSALEIPAKFGDLGIAGFMNYSQALEDALIDDEFYGGMHLTWEW
jgi:hypothetical protein